jgi:DNA primase
MGVVDEIKSRLDIIEVISSYVPSLSKAGRTYKALCPFHNEKTPSFVIFPDTQSWHCFGACGIGGDLFGFVMKQEGLDFRGALELLAAKAGVPLQEKTPDMIEADKARQRLLEMMAATAAYYHHLLLKTPQGSFSRDYLSRRGLGDDVINQFQLGYAPDQWEDLKTHLTAKGYTEKDLLDGGLLVERDDGSSGYDRFRQRLMVPIRDLQGQVIGFGARALSDDQVPKYLNSPQTVLFDKSAVLYGLDMARRAIREAGQVVIVEGYMDVLQAHQQGQANVIAQMGTALTETQLKLLQRLTKKMILALDADTAGSSATLRGINTAREALDEMVAVPTAQGLIRYESRLKVDIRVATLPPGKDPDDILKEDPAAWQQLIDSALPLVDYFIRQTTAELDLETAQGKSQAVQAILPVIREVSDVVQQDHYLRQLASLVKIDERTLRTELQRTPQPRSKSTKQPTDVQPAPPVAADRAARAVQLEEHGLAILVGNPKELQKVNSRLRDNDETPLSADDFLKIENRILFEVIEGWIANDAASLDTLLSLVEVSLEGHLASIMALWHQQPAMPEAYVDKQLADIVVRLRINRLKQQAKELRELQNNAYVAQDKEATKAYMSLMSQVNARLDRLNKTKDALSIMGRRRLEERFST